MAGIGFVLRRLARDEALSTNLRGYAHAALVSAGPWLFTVLALVGVELFARGLVPREQLQRFSVVTLYNFAFSLVLSGPIVLVVTRALADRIYARDVSEAPGMLLAALAMLGALQAAVGVPFYGFVVDMPAPERLVALVGFMLTGSIWLVAAFMSALKSYGTITGAFGGGMVAAFALAALAAPRFGGLGLLAGFNAGLALILFVLLARVLAEYPHGIVRPLGFLRDFRRYWELVLVGLLYNAAIWVDKWIMWFAPGRVVEAGAMPSHPAFDGAMFLSYLTIVPSMMLFLVSVETRFFERYLRYYRDIQGHATIQEIRRDHRAILRILAHDFRNIAVLQTAICYLAMLVAPGLIAAAGGGMEMVPIFRFGVLGALFHALLMFVMVVIAYFDLRRVLLAVAVVFFVLNAALTLATLWLGPEYYGYGYFLGALLTLVFAYLAVAQRLARLPYLTFVANNPGLR